MDALMHLYDPAYRPPQVVWTVLGCDPQQGAEAVQTALIKAIEDTKPPTNVPPTARVRRIYELLSCRYVQHLTQEETAVHLSITPRHVRREQRKAMHVLARRLWEQSRVETPSGDEIAHRGETQQRKAIPSIAKFPERRAQVRQELASLQKSAPGTVADVAAAIRGAAESGSALTSRHGIGLNVELVQPNLSVAIHPSALRQVLITAIGKLVQQMSCGRITLCAERKKNRINITIKGCPATVDRPLDSDLIREILAAHGGSIKIHTEGGCLSLGVELPSADEITVLVIDDNLDLVHFYRRYTTGTRYQIVHVAEGQLVFKSIAESEPDIIVLDVMLPDIDGWELLGHLHEHPAASGIPVIVCSVVRQKELALALGAAFYLPKPVRRRHLIQALDQVLSQALVKAPRVQGTHVTTC